MPHSIGIAVAGSARHGGTEIDGLVGLTVDGMGADCSVCEGSGEGMVMVGRRRRAGMVAVDRMMAGWYFGRSGECHRVDIAHDVAMMGSVSTTRRGIGGIELTLATVVIGVGIVTAVDFGWSSERHHIVGGGGGSTTVTSIVVRVSVVRGVCLGRGRKIHLLDRG